MVVSGAESSRGAGPRSYIDDEDAAELRALNRADRERERENAEEQGVTVEEYRRLQEECAREQREVAREKADGTCEREAAESQARMRREVGLPADVLPDARFRRVNGAVQVVVGDRIIRGSFTVDAAGNVVEQ